MKLTDVTMKLHHETVAAALVSDDGNAKRAGWLPKSQIEIDNVKDDIVEITLPTWLAEEKGLV